MVINKSEIENNKDYMYFLQSKNSNNDFIYYYLEYVICTSYQQFTKGKMNQFDLTKIQNYSLPIVSKEKQTAISNYISMSNNIINDNIKQIEHYKLLKKYLMETIPQSSLIELEKICSIITTHNNTNNIIGITRNSLNAGTVYLVNKNDILSSNSHYITITDNNYNVLYVYHIMKYMEDIIKEAASNTSQPNLNKSNLLALKIPSIELSSQQNIISFCNDFDNNINKYILANETIKSKNIFSILCKI
jgi:restriction endonuclease S subunit